MAHDTEPTGDYIRRLKERKLAEYSEQSALDRVMLDLHLQKHRVEGKAPDSPSTKLRPVGTGLSGFVAEQKAAVLGQTPFLKLLARGGAQAEQHASDKLEPFLNGCLKALQKDVEVEDRVVLDQQIYGGAWTLGPIPSPFFWGDDELRELVKKGDLKEIEAWKATHLPIVWRHWDARSVYPVFNDRGEPSEVIYVRKMTAGDIRDRWGDRALPEKGVFGYGSGYKDDEKLEIAEYVNTKWIATAILHGKNGEIAQRFEHRMRMTPVCYFPAGQLPDNDYGWYRKGALFHVRELLHSIDDTMTDIRTNIREYATAPPYVKLNTEARQLLEGWQTRIDVKQGETINLLEKEEPGRWPVPQMTADVYQYLAIARSIVEQQLVREGLAGEGPSGQSAVHLNESNQIAKAELKRAQRGLERGYRRFGTLILRCPQALSEEFPGKPDKVTVRVEDKNHKSKEIAVTPDDAKGWEELIGVEIAMNLPINEGAAISNAALAIKGGLFSPETARERLLHVQNPLEEEAKIAEHMLRAAILAVATQITTARAAGAMERGGLDPSAILERAARQPPYVSDVVTEFLSSRGAMNQARLGRGQQPSQLAGMDTQI